MDVLDLPIAVVTLDLDRTITAANAAALELFRHDDLVGKHADILRTRRASGEDVDRTEWDNVKGTDRPFAPGEQHMVALRGDDVEIEILVESAAIRDDAGVVTGAVVLVRPKYAGGRQPSSGVKIVSAVSHELRSPLTSIRGYVALLLKRWDVVSDEDRHAMLSQVDRDARRVSRLIGELLDISRIESGRVQLNRVDLDLRDLTNAVIESVTMGYPELEAAVKLSADMPLLWADNDKLTQVFTNLVENACKYASPKGITINGSFDDAAVRIEISDQGPGIPPEDLPNLFQQFFRSNIGRPSGTGLGLWISRGLVEAHKGTLAAQSDGEHGTTFTVTLPRGGFEDLHGSND